MFLYVPHVALHLKTTRNNFAYYELQKWYSVLFLYSLILMVLLLHLTSPTGCSRIGQCQALLGCTARRL